MVRKKMKVVLLMNFIPPYRVALFQALKKQLRILHECSVTPLLLFCIQK